LIQATHSDCHSPDLTLYETTLPVKLTLGLDRSVSQIVSNQATREDKLEIKLNTDLAIDGGYKYTWQMLGADPDDLFA